MLLIVFICTPFKIVHSVIFFIPINMIYLLITIFIINKCDCNKSMVKEKYGTTELVNMIDKYIISQELTDTSSEESEAKSYIAQMKEYYEKNGQDWSTVLSNNGYTEDTLQQYYA